MIAAYMIAAVVGLVVGLGCDGPGGGVMGLVVVVVFGDGGLGSLSCPSSIHILI